MSDALAPPGIARPPPPAAGDAALASGAGGVAHRLAGWLAALLLAAWPSLVGLTSPSDVGTHDQGKQVMYVVDAMQGNLLVPHERGNIATKPPLYTWCAAAIAAVFGLDEVTVRMPSVLASIALGLVVFSLGRRTIGIGPSLAALALLATTQHMAKLSFFARTDMMLAAWVALALAARAAGWATAFWLCVALGTLTKGPPGLLLPLAAVALDALLARDVAALRSLRPARGLLLVAAIVALWLLPAFALHFDAMREVLREEGVEQLTGTGEYADVKHQPFWYLIPYLFLKLAPWSPLIVVGLRDALRPGSALRPVAAWLLGGLFVFLFPATKRPDHLLPMYVPAALLAGSALAPWLRGEAIAGARALGTIVRLWAIGAGAAALVLPPLARFSDAGASIPPAPWVFALCAIAIVPITHASRPRASRRARLAAALFAQALATFAWAHTRTAAVRDGETPVLTAFAHEVARVAGDDEILFVETSAIPLQFALQRNVPELPASALCDRLAPDATPWLIAPEPVLAGLAADEVLGPRLRAASLGARSAPRPAHEGQALALVRVRAVEPPARPDTGGAGGASTTGPAEAQPLPDQREASRTGSLAR